MNASRFTITLEEKVSKAYQTFSCSLSVDVTVNEGESFEQVAAAARKQVYSIVHSTAIHGLKNALDATRQDI